MMDDAAMRLIMALNWVAGLLALFGIFILWVWIAVRILLFMGLLP